MADTSVKGRQRLAFLDWMRGVAALIMLQGHTLHSFTRRDVQAGGPYILSQFVGGIAPAVFLFLTGVTFGFLMVSRERQGHSRRARFQSALRRAGYLLGLAVLFRLQLWAFAMGQSPWTDLFKVDVLNCMALSLATLAPLALVPTRDRARWAGLHGVLVAVLAPLVTNADWSWLHPFLRAYLVPDPNTFAYFPWASFVGLGVAGGTLLRQIPSDELPGAMQWSALLGFGLLLAGQYFSALPYSFYEKTDFWLDSPGLTVIKLGILLLMVSAAFLWTEMNGDNWSLVRQLGTTSLPVYWIHIELVYGRWFGFWKNNLSLGQATLVALALIALMTLVSVAWTRRTHWSGRFLPGPRPALPRQAAGD